MNGSTIVKWMGEVEKVDVRRVGIGCEVCTKWM